MSIGSGQLIDTGDYNSFLSWAMIYIAGNGSNTQYMGYGQPESFWGATYVQTGELITAQQWQRLIGICASLAAYQQNTFVTNFPPSPSSGELIPGTLNSLTNILIALMQQSGWSGWSGPQYTGWTGQCAKTAATPAGVSTIEFNSQVIFGSYDEARYFWNAGGRVKIEFSKSSTGQQGDADWNNLANNVMADLYVVSGGILRQQTQTGYLRLQGQTYYGFDAFGGTGNPAVYNRLSGWYDLPPGGEFTKVYQQNSPNTPYNNNSIEVYISKNAAQTQLNIRAVWTNNEGDPFSGGTAPNGATPGSAPCMITTYFPPGGVSQGFWPVQSWGTPLVNCTISGQDPIPPVPVYTTTSISVCDESSLQPSSSNPLWAAYKSQAPNTPFYLLQPDTYAPMLVPTSPPFNNANLGFGPIYVNEDYGNPALASDWFTICNLNSMPSGGTVFYWIDTSASMSSGRAVEASLNLFLSKCSAANLTAIRAPTRGRENWLAPFVPLPT
jgi:hypothetical protein